MFARLPLAIAAATVSVLGLLTIGLAGGVAALLGPALAAVTAAIYVLLR